MAPWRDPRRNPAGIERAPGTSGTRIENYYGALIDTAHDAILSRLEAIGMP